MAQGKFAALAELDTAKRHRTPSTFNRKKGKKSDPDFQQYSVILKKATWRQAQERIRSDETFHWSGTGRPDFSMLLQSLLEKWIEEGK